MVPVHAHVPNTWGAGVVGSRSGTYKYKSACFVSGHSTNAKPHAPIAHRFAETKKKQRIESLYSGGHCVAFARHFQITDAFLARVSLRNHLC